MDHRPRLFWRRVAAFLVDYLLVTALTVLILLPFMNANRTPLRLDSVGFTTSACRNLKNLPQEFHDLIAPKPINAATLCSHRTFGVYNGRTVEIIYDLRETKNGATTRRSQKTLTVAIDADDKIVRTPVMPQSTMTFLLLILGGVTLHAKGRRSPGKALLGLEVQGTGCIICRELRRLGPFLAYAIVAFGAAFLGPEALVFDGFVPLFALGGLISVFAALYYILPWIRWRGAMPWDKATGFSVANRV